MESYIIFEFCFKVFQEITIATIEVAKELKIPRNSMQSETVSFEKKCKKFINFLLSFYLDMVVSGNTRIGAEEKKVNIFVRSEGGELR